MRPALTELSPVPLPDDKPPNRGKFSPEREYWEQLHHARYTKWQLGHSAEDIAAEEGITSNAVRHSISWCEGRLSNAQVVQARNTRLRLRTFNRLSERYIEELENLMADPNPIVRSRALEAFRKTIGLEMAAGVQVNLSQQTALIQNGPTSFEQIMDQVRKRLLAEQRERTAIPESIDSGAAAPALNSCSEE